VLSKFNDEIKRRREFKTVDIVRRLGVITPNRLYLRNYPITNPVTAFNPSLLIEGEQLTLYARITLGYFTYASAVAEIKIPIAEVGDISRSYYNAEIVVYPENKFDIWGVEDPRVYKVGERTLMTYCGRTVYYFNPAIRVERTLPVTAVYEDGKWRKICVFRVVERLRAHVVSDKDAFLVKTRDLLLFHRIHTDDENYYLTVSKVPEDALSLREFREVEVTDTCILFEKSPFEEKIGWGSPPIKVDDEYLLFLHSVDAEFKCYRVFAILINEDVEVTAITPYYIMEPRENYEKYGDRPFTIFPCGASIYDDKVLISYGASDSAIGIGEVDLSEIMSILDSNRLEGG